MDFVSNRMKYMSRPFQVLLNYAQKNKKVMPLSVNQSTQATNPIFETNANATPIHGTKFESAKSIASTAGSTRFASPSTTYMRKTLMHKYATFADPDCFLKI